MTTRVRLGPSHENAMTSPDPGLSRPAASFAAAVASVVSVRATVTARAGSVRSAHTPCSTWRRSLSTGWAATTAFAAATASANPVPSGATSVLAWANRASEPPSSRWPAQDDRGGRQRAVLAAGGRRCDGLRGTRSEVLGERAL